MIILRSIADLSLLPGPVVLAAGTFDGLHLGHQALIRSALDEAVRIHGTAVVLSFDRHPALLIRPEKAPRLLTRIETKLDLLEGMGVPVLLLLEFSEEFASQPAEVFIRNLVSASNPLHEICVGSQWSFGRGGTGNIALLEKLGEESGFSVDQIDPVEIAGKPISSTRVRQAIASGDFSEAATCLGRKYLLSGRVITGAGLGAKIGFPTANLDVAGMQLPPDGVYAVRVHHGGSILSGVCNIGVRPTVDPSAQHRTVEVHLFDFSENFVGKELGVEFIQFLRVEQKFAGLEELKAQIARDSEQALRLLSSWKTSMPPS
jgi:riboflavin kinase/FMN adenylyltransferase